MPIQAFLQDRMLVERGLKNYWGYNTIGFFAIEPRYLSERSRNEMRVAVRRLHAAGIEVILDVVYNHTAEGTNSGRRFRFAASTTRVTTASSRTTNGTTSTIPAPATRSTCRIRACCRW